MGSTPNLIQGQVPTAAQWNSYFADKQDDLGYVPVSTGGGALNGLLTVFQSETTGVGLNIPPGATPSSPNNGDIWATASGLFARIGGSTIPLTGGAITGFQGGTLTAPLTLTPSTISGAGLNVAPGTPPNSPNNGDVWVTTTSVFARVNGVTQNLLAFGNIDSLTLKATPASNDEFVIWDVTGGALKKVANSTIGPAFPALPTLSFVVYSGSQTITIPTGFTKALVVMWGATGGSGGVNNGNSGGTGAGGYLEKWLTGLTPGNTLAYTQGTAGTAGTAAPTGGGNGGTTTLASGTQSISTLTCNGSTGTAAATSGNPSTETAGATATGGDVNITGQDGTVGRTVGVNDFASSSASQGGVNNMSKGAAGVLSGTTLAGNAGSSGGLKILWVT